MTPGPTCPWRTSTGTVRPHHIAKLGEPLPQLAGNYIFAGHTLTGWQPHYIGETTNLARIPELPLSSKDLACALQRGTTHIHFFINQDEHSRKTLQRELIQRYHPPCNVP